MPNGNILILGWEKKRYSEAINAGRISVENEIWPLVIYEVTLNQDTEFEIIWEWHIWDHIIQDVDISLPNFGIIEDHPELIDINIGNFTNPNEGDWLHTNAIDYNSGLDQIVFSSKHFNEIFIIDHSTTILEASGHDGGNSNKGGDILYRWGNPANYGRGDNSDQKLNAQHGVHWIPLGFPGAGKFLIFNNNPSDTLSNSNHFGNSSIVEILPPLNVDGNYFLSTDSIYGPEEYDLIYGDDDSFFSSFQSGAYRLTNGNTIIPVNQEKSIFEINQDNQVVWECKIDSLINENGFTALMFAFRYAPKFCNQQSHIIEQLIEKMSKDGVSQKNKDGWTPLMLAIEKNLTNIIPMLLVQPVIRVSEKDYNQAIRTKNPVIIKCIQDHITNNKDVYKVHDVMLYCKCLQDICKPIIDQMQTRSTT